MILYFADRTLNIIGQASSNLPRGLTLLDDLRTCDVETGVDVFECKIPFTAETRAKAEECTELGNHILVKDEDEDKLYTIIDAEIDTKEQEIYVYAEDDGMDLLNEIVGPYAADKAYPVSHYINKYAANAGFEIGVNEISDLERKLAWDGESTATERIASVATQFGGCEISYSFEVEGLTVSKKYINIYEKRGDDSGITLRLNQDVDRIITEKTISNLATALVCEGGIPEDSDTAITLNGYEYDDGDFYVEGGVLKSRKALEKWDRFLWKTGESSFSGGHITKRYSYDTTSKQTLCAHAITQLKKICDMEVNYKVDLSSLPKNVKAGDRVNIVDDAGELYLSTRLLRLEISRTNQEHKATLGEHLIKTSGISQKVAELAADFARNAASAERALEIATSARDAAEQAQAQADEAAGAAGAATQAAQEATAAAQAATESAAAATQAASDAEAAVDAVEESVASMEQSIADAEAAIEQAKQAAETAETMATEAHTAAENAQQAAEEAQQAAEEADGSAQSALQNSQEALSSAEQAKQDARAAATTAAAAKLDARQAQAEIDSLGENLTTLSNTMTAEYARKTDLTEASANLQSQITQNAALISSTVSMFSYIDETANDAQDQVERAQLRAQAAREQAEQAALDALAAQEAASRATQAANQAQAEADAARGAADTARRVANEADAALAAARADLETIMSRADATQEDIEAARQAVEAAQAAAERARADADVAAETAAVAQETAQAAVQEAGLAQDVADAAAEYAEIAQSLADEAEDAAEAQQAADEAAQIAAAAQETADGAMDNASAAMAAANQAAADAAAARQAAADADAKAAQAEFDLAAAQQNLADVTSRVDATVEEVEAAQADVEVAQAAADRANADAEAAQATADAARAEADAAQQAASVAQAAADQAQRAANEAQQAADAAQYAVNALEIRIASAQTKLTQTAEAIELLAVKTEVVQTLGGYYTRTETDARIRVAADEIAIGVRSVRQELEGLEVGGRNLWINSARYVDETPFSTTSTSADNYIQIFDGEYIYCPTPFKAGDAITVQGKSNLPWSSTHGNGADGKVGYWLYLGTLAQASSGQYISPVFLPGDNVSSEFVKTYTIPAVSGIDDIYIGFRFNTYSASGASVEGKFWDIKMEKGNTATDWTPAPEDVDEAIIDSTDAVREEMVEQDTAIVATCEELILSAGERYVETGDYEEFRQTVESQLSVMANEISMSFTTTTENINDVNGELQSFLTTFSKFIKFTSETAITIGSGDSAITLEIDNETGIAFKRDGVQFGWWDGTDFHTGNIIVEVNERAQFGNFALVPRSDGSLSFLKVGE